MLLSGEQTTEDMVVAPTQKYQIGPNRPFVLNVHLTGTTEVRSSDEMMPQAGRDQNRKRNTEFTKQRDALLDK